MTYLIDRTLTHRATVAGRLTADAPHTEVGFGPKLFRPIVIDITYVFANGEWIAANAMISGPLVKKDGTDAKGNHHDKNYYIDHFRRDKDRHGDWPEWLRKVVRDNRPEVTT